MKTNRSFHAQAGINMVEIMIALLIGAFLIGGLIQLFIGTKKSYNMQDANSRLQENGRFAIEFLSLDVHEADFWACWADKVNVFTALGVAVIPGLSGNDNDNTDPNIIDGTDSITLSGFKNEGITLTGDSSGTADLIIAPNTGNSLNAGNWAMVTDCEFANIFQITSDVGGGTNVVHANQTLENYGITIRQAQIFKWYGVTYDIRSGANGRPALFKTEFNPDSTLKGVPQELVEGIEDMQILYGEDTDADGLPNRYLTASAADGVNMDNVKGVRISLLASSVTDGLTSALQPNTLTYANGSKSVTTCPKGSTAATCTGTVRDGRIRNVYEITLAIRSRLK
jgi:type IV pilus assembly protein PilW